jgi:hypothetical protein
MSTEREKSLYRRTLRQTIFIRRFTGSGANRLFFDYKCRGDVRGYEARELVGSIQQGDRRVLALAEDLLAQDFMPPVTASDAVIMEGKQIAIIAPGARRAADGEILAWDLQTRG